MTDEIRIDLSDPDTATVFSRYAQAIADATREYELCVVRISTDNGISIVQPTTFNLIEELNQ